MAGPVRMTVPVSLGETFFDSLLMEFSREYLPDLQQREASTSRYCLPAVECCIQYESPGPSIGE